MVNNSSPLDGITVFQLVAVNVQTVPHSACRRRTRRASIGKPPASFFFLLFRQKNGKIHLEAKCLSSPARVSFFRRTSLLCGAQHTEEIKLFLGPQALDSQLSLQVPFCFSCQVSVFPSEGSWKGSARAGLRGRPGGSASNFHFLDLPAWGETHLLSANESTFSGG